MDVCIKPKFLPQKHDESLDINTTLFIFAQVVAENVNKKKLLVYYYKQDDQCIFDEIKDMLMKLLSIELSVVFIKQDDFYGSSITDDGPHIVFVDDILEDNGISASMVSTVPPNTFLIGRGIKNNEITESIYLPLYKVGKGKDYLELARWNVYQHRLKIELAMKVSVVTVMFEADLESLRKSVKASSMYHQLIIITKYPDTLGLKKIVQEHRQLTDAKYTFVVFTNHAEITSETLNQKQRLNSDLVYTVLKDGIWGGEYYVPVKN